MNKLFNLARIPRILFGPGMIQNLEKEILQFGNQVLFVTGKKSFYETTFASGLNDKLLKSGISFHIVSIENEPSAIQIDTICKQFRTKKINVVVGLGGGSVLDAGKAISAMIKVDGSVKDYLEGVGTKVHPGLKIPFIAVPTTSGTGSETTSNAVISEVGEYGFKKSLRHPNFIPELAIVDPELTISCPKSLTAATGMDAFTQLLESYVSTKASPFTDAIALEAIKHINSGLTKACDNGSDYEARISLAYASMSSGITLTNAGLGTVHGFASAIGAHYDVPHGIVCGTLMSACNEFTIQKLRNEDTENIALAKYAEVGKIFSNEISKSQNFYIDFLVNKLKELTDSLSIPKLGTFGLKEADFDKIISKTDNKNNPIALSNDELKEILKIRL